MHCTLHKVLALTYTWCGYEWKNNFVLIIFHWRRCTALSFTSPHLHIGGSGCNSTNCVLFRQTSIYFDTQTVAWMHTSARSLSFGISWNRRTHQRRFANRNRTTFCTKDSRIAWRLANLLEKYKSHKQILIDCCAEKNRIGKLKSSSSTYLIAYLFPSVCMNIKSNSGWRIDRMPAANCVGRNN